MHTHLGCTGVYGECPCKCFASTPTEVVPKEKIDKRVQRGIDRRIARARVASIVERIMTDPSITDYLDDDVKKMLLTDLEKIRSRSEKLANKDPKTWRDRYWWRGLTRV